MGVFSTFLGEHHLGVAYPPTKAQPSTKPYHHVKTHPIARAHPPENVENMSFHDYKFKHL